MKNAPFRFGSGGLINRNRVLNFTFDGKKYTGFEGDTLASALLANGVRLVARSFKLHRPRGIMAAGAEEMNAFVSVGEAARLDTNVRATQVDLYEGLVARSLNNWPSVGYDIGGVLEVFSRFLPAGFYYKTFMWPRWGLFEGIIRRAAGLGKPSAEPDPDRYEHMHAATDVLVVGSGPAGLMAALGAASAGARVILAEQEPDLGGSLLWQHVEIDGMPALEWVETTVKKLKQLENVTLLPRTTVTGYYDNNSFIALERLPDQMPGDAPSVRQRMWKMEASRVVLATGAMERPLTFPDNDRPGIMMVSGVLRYVCQYGVLPGQKIVAFVNNDGAYSDISAVCKAGGPVGAIVDSRKKPGQEAVALADAAGVEIITGACIASVKGSNGLRSVRVKPIDAADTGAVRDLDCDLLVMSGGWNPVVHLFSQSGGKLRYDEEKICFLPGHSVQAEQTVGAANGNFSLAECLEDGLKAGLAAAKHVGAKPVKIGVPAVTGATEVPFSVESFWMVPEEVSKSQRQWIDFHNDVTVKDVALAARENFIAVEHLKRYTTLGMALDQGKTSNVNGLAVMGQLTGRSPDAVGTTTFRPPYTPVTFGAIAGARHGRLYSPIRHLPTHDRLVELGGKMEDYGGWVRPAYFAPNGETEEVAVRQEVLAVRNSVGITDYSPLGKIELRGKDAARFLNLMVLTNVETIKIGKGRYTLMLNENGIVIDDGIITRLADDHFILGTTSGGAARMAATCEEWLQCEWPDMDVYVANVTTGWGVILVSGPKARDLVSRLGSSIDFSADALPHMSYVSGALGDIPLRVNRVSFTGEVSYEISLPAGYAHALWNRLMELGQDLNVQPFGLESLLIMRLEKGFIHVGSDTDGTTIPDDIGFGVPARKKTIEYVGRRSLMRPDAMRETRFQLVGLEALDKARALPLGAHLLPADVNALPARTHGYVTSSAMSPALNKPVALGLLQAGRARTGEVINVYADGSWCQARVVLPGFYDKEGVQING